MALGGGEVVGVCVEGGPCFGAAGIDIVQTSHGQVLGTMRDLLATLDQAGSHYRSRNRMNPRATLTMILPAWLVDMCRVDVLRVGDRFEHYVWSDAQFGAELSARGIVGVQSLDYQRLDDTQRPGPLIGWAGTVKIMLFAQSEFAFMNGGEWDLGVIRDSTLTGTNDALAFFESMEAAGRTGSAGAFEIEIDVCSNGTTVAGVDLDICVSGS